MDFLKIRATQI